MISDEPDEDADTLDDDTALETYFGETSNPGSGAGSISEVSDWPPPEPEDAWLTLDPEMLSWFQARYADWRRQIRHVLNAWIAAQGTRRRTDHPLRLAAPVPETGRSEDRS